MGNPSVIGITGGTGLYEMPEMEILEEIEVDTPFGEPSDRYMRGNLGGTEVIFLSRHRRGHVYPATYLNFRANIYGFKSLGVDTLISVGAVGSMKEKYHPTDIVIPDQFYDNTKSRTSTFFDDTPAVHIEFADPVCPVLSSILYEAGTGAGANMHRGGTYLCIDGPAFSTRAESNIYRGWGVDIIGMTSVTEAKLAREAEICYVSLAMITDYDVWHEKSEDVTVDVILENMRKTVGDAKEILHDVIPEIPAERGCSCRSALENAIVTDPSAVPRQTRLRLNTLLGDYLPPEA